MDLSGIDVSKLSDDEIAQIEAGTFFKKLKAVDMSRNYSIIVDMSGSMACIDAGNTKSRWQQAEDAVKFLCPNAIKCDPDGICLYFFDSDYEKFENIKSEAAVMSKFASRGPNSSTALHKVLADAVLEDGAGGCCMPSTPQAFKPETILVITDGSPDSASSVESVIIEATHKMNSDNDLSITFVQVGNDPSVDKWLQTLDNGLKARGAKFDIVDVITHSQLKGMSFNDFVAKSLQD